MAGPNDHHDHSSGKASELDRSASLRRSVRMSHGPGDDDDYDMLALGVSDGFRPAHVAHDHASSHSPRPSVSHPDSPASRLVSSPPRPSSISKPHRHPDSFVLRNDAAQPDEPSNPFVSGRSSLESTDTPYMSAEAPYEGPSGPSHPYQMYPQNVRLARTASLATTSTAPVSERSYTGPRGPTHPYGMYPQSTMPEADVMASEPVRRDINVGFPGAADAYQRRLGPDGEEVADMIGPDGHTEQLPPYTRYPEEAYHRKALGMASPQPTQAPTPAPIQTVQTVQPAQPAQPTQAIAGAGGIGLATRNPEFESVENLRGANSPQSRRSVRSFTSESSHHDINTAAVVATDEKQQLKGWQLAAKRKVWGIVPCWAIVLAVVVLIMMGVVLGAVIGTILGHRRPHHHRPGPNGDGTVSGSIETFTSVPANLRALQTGTYAMPLMPLLPAPDSCLVNSDQSQAWNCDIVMSELSLRVDPLVGDRISPVEAYTMSFVSNESYTLENYVYSYGMQPPDLINTQLRLVNDTFELSNGPAWAFWQPYNKTVIIPESLLAAPNTSSSSKETEDNYRRMVYGNSGFDPGSFKRKGVAEAGDKLWICQWEQTILEFFIYVQQDSRFGLSSGYNGVSIPPPTSSGGYTAAATTPATTGTTAVEARGFDGPTPSYPTQYSGAEFAGAFESPTPQSETTSSPSQTTATATSSSSSSSTTDYFTHSLLPNLSPPYPQVIKMEERRPDGYAQIIPTCILNEVQNNGQPATPVLENGSPVEVELVEEDASYSTSSKKRSIEPVRRFIASRDHTGFDNNDDMAQADCGCTWWLN
ncbi:hypothetical protein GGR56DRAFT_423090 [Xylariaceae sp. FL0804]|nr:hypothetical protein GGR56DRAFT_423090 [Xylariaceae sp. FL0804]